MSDTDAELDRLHDLLNAIPAERDGMTIAELDGYVAALIVCPEMVLPSEWLPGVWGGNTNSRIRAHGSGRREFGATDARGWRLGPGIAYTFLPTDHHMKQVPDSLLAFQHA